MKSEASDSAPRRGTPGTFRRALYEWITEVVQPFGTAKALWALPSFTRRFRQYRKLGPGRLRWRDTIPKLRDASPSTPFDAHYFYMSAWAMKSIHNLGPHLHVDIGGPVSFAACLAALVPTTFIDYRPLHAEVQGLSSVAGDLLHLPLKDRSAPSLSCLHVVEHIGLGRYGDALDAEGSRKACAELARVLADGGSLFLALPVGRAATHFNAHRIHRATDVIEMFQNLSLAGLALVNDEGRYVHEVVPEDCDRLSYGCGMFHFRKV